MALSTVASFTTTENPPSGFQASGANGIKAAGAIGVADSTASAASMSYSTQLNADQEAQMDLVFTSRVEAAVYAGLQTANDFTSNHYRVETTTVDGNFHGIQIVKRRSGSESTLASTSLRRGKYTSGDSIRIRKIDAGTVTIIEAWKDGYKLLSVIDSTNPIQGAGYVGAWIAASSSGMGIDNFMAGNLSVYWVANSNKTNPTQSAGTNNTDTNIGGSGLDRGSFTYPFQTIAYGSHKSRMTATGAVLMIRGGNYPERLNDAFSDTLWKTGTSWNNPTTIQGFPGETVLLNSGTTAQIVAIKSNSNGVGGTQYLQFLDMYQDGQNSAGGGFSTGFKNSYIRFQNIVSGNNKGNPFTLTQYQGQNDSDNHHMEIISCVGYGASEGSGTHGVYDQISGSLIEFSEFYDNYPNPTGTGAYGIQHNIFAVPDNGTVNTRDIIYRYNKCYGNGGGIVIAGVDNALIYGNWVYKNNNQGGINVQGTAGFGKVVASNTLIANNTCYHNNTNIGAGYSIRMSAGVENPMVINNILYKPPNYTYSGIQSDGVVNPTITNNLNGTKGASQGSEIDPELANEGDGTEDFHISATSPARGSVGGPYTDLSAYFTYDFYGLPITDWDLGAVQYENPVSGTPPVNAILQALVMAKNTEGIAYLDVTDAVDSPLVKVRIKLGSQATFTTVDTSSGVTFQ